MPRSKRSSGRCERTNVRALAEEQEWLAQCDLAVQSQQLLDEAQAIKSGLPSKLVHAEAELARASSLRPTHPMAS